MWRHPISCSYAYVPTIVNTAIGDSCGVRVFRVPDTNDHFTEPAGAQLTAATLLAGGRFSATVVRLNIPLTAKPARQRAQSRISFPVYPAARPTRSLSLRSQIVLPAV